MGTLLGLFSSGQAPRPRVAPERADSEVPLTPNVGQGYGRCIVRSTGEGVHGERQQRQRARQDLYPVASQPHLTYSLRPATSMRGYAIQGSERRQETHHSNCVFFQDFSAAFREHVLHPCTPEEWTFPGAVDVGRCHYLGHKRWPTREGERLVPAEADRRIAPKVPRAQELRT